MTFVEKNLSNHMSRLIITFSGKIILLIMFIMFYVLPFRIKLIGILLMYSTIQKPNYRQFTPIAFAATLKPHVFEGVNYKRCHARAVLWLTIMKCFHASKGKPKGKLTSEQEQAFQSTNTFFTGVVLSVLGEKIVDRS